MFLAKPTMEIERRPNGILNFSCRTTYPTKAIFEYDEPHLIQ